MKTCGRCGQALIDPGNQRIGACTICNVVLLWHIKRMLDNMGRPSDGESIRKRGAFKTPCTTFMKVRRLHIREVGEN